MLLRHPQNNSVITRYIFTFRLAAILFYRILYLARQNLSNLAEGLTKITRLDFFINIFDKDVSLIGRSLFKYCKYALFFCVYVHSVKHSFLIGINEEEYKMAGECLCLVTKTYFAKIIRSVLLLNFLNMEKAGSIL